MVFSRIFVAICVGIFIPSFFGVIVHFIPSLNNLIFGGLCLILTYGVAGFLCVWGAREKAYLAASLVSIIICIFQYNFTVFFIEGDMIFTPNVFAVAILIGILFGNFGAWLQLKWSSKRNKSITA